MISSPGKRHALSNPALKTALGIFTSTAMMMMMMMMMITIKTMIVMMMTMIKSNSALQTAAGYSLEADVRMRMTIC